MSNTPAMETGRLFPLKDRLLKACQDFDPGGDLFLVFVDSLSETYIDESEVGHNTQSSPDSPFKGRTPHECALLLQQLRRDTGSAINYESFVIFDERSPVDDTVLLVSECEDIDWQGSVRVAFELADLVLGVWEVGDGTVFEDMEEAAKQGDGVLRDPFYVRP